MNAASQMPLRTPQLLEGSSDLGTQFRQIQGHAVREISLRVCPHSFVRVELGSVRGKAFQMKPRKLPTEILYGESAVGADVVPDDDDVAAELLQQMTKERDDLRLSDVLSMNLEVETHPLAAGTHRNPGDHRESIMPVSVVDNRSSTTRCPGPANIRNQEEAGFIDEDEVGTQPLGVFFTRGHSVAFHFRIRASSRSSARRIGRCGVQPSWCMRRPT